MRVLVLGGTGEARQLASALDARGDRVVSSLAGRVDAPAQPPGEVRTGGFGGVDGLAAFLTRERMDAVVDATHPFAARITANAVAAATAAHVPLVLLRRPGWTEQPGDDWRRVPSLAAAAALLPDVGSRAFLAVGRGGIMPFVELPLWFLLRAVDPPRPPLPARHHVVLDRGPFTLDGERRLLRGHRVDVLVTRDSGGAATAAKLVAARELGLPVVLVDRPPPPAGAVSVASIEEVLAHLRRRRANC